MMRNIQRHVVLEYSQKLQTSNNKKSFFAVYFIVFHLCLVFDLVMACQITNILNMLMYQTDQANVLLELQQILNKLIYLLFIYV